MLTKVKNKQKGPSWFEVGLGAVLSILLGAVLGAALLVFKPVQAVKEVPKDPPAGAVYYIEGNRDFNKTVEANSKRTAFAAGQSAAVDEGELNVLLGTYVKASTAPAAATPVKAGDKPPAPEAKSFDPGPLNARIRAGKIQFANTVSFNVLGYGGSVIVQTSGDFKRRGSVFEYDPDVIYVGGCPVQRFIFVRDWILKKLLFTQPMPGDIAASWPKLADITIDETTLRLRMP